MNPNYSRESTANKNSRPRTRVPNKWTAGAAMRCCLDQNTTNGKSRFQVLWIHCQLPSSIFFTVRYDLVV